MERGRGGKELGAWLGRMCIKGPNPLHRQLFLRGGTRRTGGFEQRFRTSTQESFISGWNVGDNKKGQRATGNARTDNNG